MYDLKDASIIIFEMKSSKSNYLFDVFNFSSSYRQRLVEIFRHTANIEHGGYRIFDGTYSHILQIPEELVDFIIMLKRYEKNGRKLQKFLEIGFGNGITNTILNKFFYFDDNVVVDNFSTMTSNDALVANLRHKNLIIICGDSTSKSCINMVSKFKPFDLIFIDGNHTSPYVEKDFENYSQLLNDGGIIALHDIVSSEWPDVRKAWKHIKQNKKWVSNEIICRNYKIQFGIGILTKK